jgi:hypothetical protein
LRSGIIGVDDLEVHAGGALLMKAPFGDAEEVAIRGESPATSPEFIAALREGKLVARTRLRWVIDGVEWVIGVRGDTLMIGGLRPPLRSAPPDHEWIARRLELMRGFGEAFDRVYDAFIAIRLNDKAWRAELDTLRAWVAGEAEVAREPVGVAVGDDEGGPSIIEIRDED